MIYSTEEDRILKEMLDIDLTLFNSDVDLVVEAENFTDLHQVKL